MLHDLSFFHSQHFLIIHKYKFPFHLFTLSINICSCTKCRNEVLLKGIVNYSYIFRFKLFANLVSVFPRNAVILVLAAANCVTTLGGDALHLYPAHTQAHCRFPGFLLLVSISLKRTTSRTEKVIWSFTDVFRFIQDLESCRGVLSPGKATSSFIRCHVLVSGCE